MASQLPVPFLQSSGSASPSLQAIISRLPSPISIKRVSLTSPTSSPSPSHKRVRITEDSILSSPDMRRQVLVKKVQQKLYGGITVSIVGSNDIGKVVELDDSIEIVTVTDTNDNESLSLEEREAIKKPDVAKVEVKKNDNEPTSPPELEVVKKPDVAKVEVKNQSEIKSVESKVTTEKKVEIQWIPVKRCKRLMRFFLFGATVEGEKDEVIVEKAETNQKIPRVINGRRPYIVVPGVEYDLEEGEGVIMDNEEDAIEIRLARNEKYERDSFVCDTGYLSDEEMMETPSVDKVISKVKQQRRANNIQAKLKFEKMGEPDVLGCLWWSGKGGQNQKMKKWQAIVFSSTPVPTSFTTPVPEEQSSPLLPPPPVLVPAPTSTLPPLPPIKDYTTKYHIKYLVKHLVHKSMIGAEGPSQCSTPMPGQQLRRQLPATPSVLTTQVVEEGDNILKENRELLDRYVVKYFNKFKYQL